MESQADTEVSVGGLPDKPKRKALAENSYEAIYSGLKVFIDDSPWGKKKIVKLAFKVTTVPFQDTMVYYKGSMFKLDNGDYVIGDKSELAQRIFAITGGQKTIGENHKGTRVIVSIKNRTSGPKSKNPGEVYDYVDTVLRQPGQAVAAATTTAQQQPTAATKPAPQPVAAGVAAKPNDNLLDDLADLSDFEDASK